MEACAGKKGLYEVVARFIVTIALILAFIALLQFVKYLASRAFLWLLQHFPRIAKALHKFGKWFSCRWVTVRDCHACWLG